MILATFSNCSLLSHLSAAPARQCKRAQSLPATRDSFQSAIAAANAQIREGNQHSFERAQTKSTMLARLARRTRRTVRLLSDDAAPAVPPQRIVVAVGGNALQRRGDRLTIENMLKAAKQMVRSRRFEVLRRLHAVDVTRVHLTIPGVVSFSISRPFGPNRDAPRRRIPPSTGRCMGRSSTFRMRRRRR